MPSNAGPEHALITLPHIVVANASVVPVQFDDCNFCGGQMLKTTFEEIDDLNVISGHTVANKDY